MGTGGKLQLEEGTAGGTFVGFKAPDTEVVNDLIWTLPSTDGSNGQVMVTDGNKTLSWFTASSESNLLSEVTSRINSDSSLQASIGAEYSSRLVADSSLYAALGLESSTRSSVDSSLQTSLNSEYSARVVADSSLYTAIATKASLTGSNTFSGAASFQSSVFSAYIPYTQRVTGSVTTDGSGNATIYVASWGWGDFSSFKRGGLVSVYLYNNGNFQQISQLYHAVSSFMTQLASGAYSSSSAWGATLSFTANQGNGNRYFSLSGASPSTTYTYTIQLLCFDPTAASYGV